MTGPNHRPRGAVRTAAREARARRSFDAVLASYIRELSAADAPPVDSTGRDNGERPGARPGRSVLQLQPCG
jgi:hypothetical protein